MIYHPQHPPTLTPLTQRSSSRAARPSPRLPLPTQPPPNPLPPPHPRTATTREPPHDHHGKRPCPTPTPTPSPHHSAAPTCGSAQGLPAPQRASHQHGGGHVAEGGAGCDPSQLPGRPGHKMAAVLAGGSQRVMREAVRRSTARLPAPGCWGCVAGGSGGCAVGRGQRDAGWRRSWAAQGLGERLGYYNSQHAWRVLAAVCLLGVVVPAGMPRSMVLRKGGIR